MENDPGEMVNLAANPAYLEVLHQHRAYLEEFAKNHQDYRALDMLQLDNAGTESETQNS